jgi:hypothetical protein
MPSIDSLTHLKAAGTTLQVAARGEQVMHQSADKIEVW